MDGCPPGGGPALAVLRHEEGGLADTVVRFTPPPAAARRPRTPRSSPTDVPVRLAGCLLEPRALVTRVGDHLVVHNEDKRFHALGLYRLDGGTEHRVQTIPLAPRENNVRLTLNQPGIYRIRSDQLLWMRGLVLVLGAGEHGVTTAADGTFVAQLPAGPWNVTMRHEVLGEARTTVDVTAGETSALYSDFGSSLAE